jgi:glyoxylase I family protein
MSRIHHVALGARDVARVAEFYGKVFDLREVARHSEDSGVLRSIWLDLGGSILMIEKTNEAERIVEGVGAGPFLLAFQVTHDERKNMEARLLSVSSTIESRSLHTSYARDPEGNRIAISHYPLPK